MSDIEQIKQEVAELLDIVYAGNEAVAKMAMSGFLNSPVAGNLGFWEDLRKGFIAQAGGEQAVLAKKEEAGRKTAPKPVTAPPQSVAQNAAEAEAAAKAISEATAEYTVSVELAAAVSKATQEKTDNDFYYVQVAGTAGVSGSIVIVKYKGKEKYINIPGSINGKIVSGIGIRAFSNSNLKGVTIPEGVTFIGKEAFSSNSIIELKIPDSVISIGEAAFQRNGLTNLIIGSGVKTIGKSAFESNDIKNLDLGSSVVVIEYNAFYNAKLEGSLNIPQSVKSIGDRAFGDNPITLAVIPDGKIEIGERVFEKTTKVIKASEAAQHPAVAAAPAATSAKPVLHSNAVQYCETCRVPIREDEWFCAKCGSRTTLAEPVDGKEKGKFTSARSDANMRAKKYEAQFIIDGKEGGYSFKTIKNTYVIITSYDGKDTNIQIPAQFNGVPVTEIGERAFSKKGITAVTIPGSVKIIGRLAFYENKLTGITIPGTVETVEQDAFSQNDLTSIVIEEGVKSIGKSAFSQTSKFNEESSKIANVVIPGSITEITERAFESSRIASVTICAGVKTIGDNAFLRNQLKKIVFPEGLTEIGYRAFSENFIDSITFPASLVKIGKSAFSGAKTLTVLTLPPNLKTIGDEAFLGCKLREINIPASVKTIGENAFAENEIMRVTINDGVTTIGEKAFYRNKIESLTIPPSVRTIEKEAFYVNNISSLSLVSGIKEIGVSAFASNKINGNLIIPETLETISEDAFKENQLTGVEIRAACNIDNGVFSKNQIGKVIIGRQVKNIGKSAFADNKPLSAVAIPEGVKFMFSFDGQVYKVKENTDGLSFSDAMYWQDIERRKQTFAAQRTAGAPKNPVTFHDASGRQIGSSTFEVSSGSSVHAKVTGRILDAANVLAGEISTFTTEGYSDEEIYCARYKRQTKGTYAPNGAITADGKVLLAENLDFFTLGTHLLKSSVVREAEQYIAGTVKNEGGAGVAYNKAGVKVGEVRNAGEFAAVYAASILLFLIK